MMKKHPSDCRCSICLSSAELANSLEGLNAPSNDTMMSRVILPTASKTDRFVGCAFPWGLEASDNEVGPEARFGSAYHAVMEVLRKKKLSAEKFKAWRVVAESFGSDVDPDALQERVTKSIPVLKEWLASANPWKIRFDKWRLEYETAIAYNMVTGEARRCELPEPKTHEYRDRHEDEIPGTIDLGGWWPFKNRAVLVLDYKSGFDVGSPNESGQLQTLALASAQLHRADRAYIALLHAPAHMEPTIYADFLDGADFRKHADALSEAHRRRRDGSLRPDYYCKWCQAFSQCPANQPALVELRASKTALTTAEDVGAAHQKLRELEKRFAQMSAVVEAEIRSWIAKNGDAIRPDGRDVGFVDRPYTRLSQASIIRALGEKRGRQEIERLRKLGCIEEGERPELRVK